MWEYLTLVSGTTVIRLTEPPFHLISYTPAVADLVPRDLATLGPYADVADTCQLFATGCTPSEALTNVNKIITLLNQSVAWTNGDNLTAVTVVGKLRGSSGTLTGTVKNGQQAQQQQLRVGPGMGEFSGLWVSDPITFTVVRQRGVWVTGSDVTTSAGTTTSQLNVINNLASVDTYSPVKIETSDLNNTGGTAQVVNPSLFFANTTGDIAVLSATNAAVSGVSFVASTPGAALSGANVASAASNVLITVPTALQRSRRLALYLMGYASADGSSTFSCSYTTYGAAVAVPQRTVPIYTGCRPYQVAILSCEGGIGGIGLQWTNLQVDCFILMSLDDPAARVIPLDRFSRSAFSAGATNTRLRLDARQLTRPLPTAEVYQASTGFAFPLGYRGDPGIIQSGTLLTTLWLAGVGTTGNPQWRITDNAGTPAPVSIAYTVTRRLSTLVPQ